jgi:hypothetical protein
MPNNIKYHFADFTLNEYAGLIDLAKENYNFKSYIDFNLNSRDVLWRHDIDMSPEMALEMAKIEFSKKVKATYFILLHSDFYNLLNPYNYKIIKNIITLGHDIGLHFDPFFFNIDSESQLDAKIVFEKEILEKIFEIKINVFSFHNNTPFTLSCEKESYGGLINTYSKRFKSVPYCSDSNGYWRFKRLKDVLSEATEFNLHILTHEIWWQKEIMSPKEKVQRCVDLSSQAILDTYNKALPRLNLKNIDWE